MTDSGIRIEDNVLKSREVTRPINFPDLGSFILKNLEIDADALAQIDPTTGKEQTRGEMRDKSIRCALWMRSQGIGVGDVIAISCNDQLIAAIPCFATLFLGAILNPLHAEFNTSELRYLLRTNRPKLAFADEESAVTLAEAANTEGLDLKIVVLGQAAGFFEFAEIISEPGVEDIQNFKTTPLESPDTIATIMYTSGTTGLPKGVAVSHAVWLKTLLQALPPSTHVTFISFGSVYWVTGITSIFITIIPGYLAIIPPPFEEHLTCRLIEKYKINQVMLSPNMVIGLVKSDALGKYDLSSVKTVYYGGSALDDSLVKVFAKYFPANVVIMTVYGLTETCGRITLRIFNSNSKPNSCGKLIDNIQLKVVDPETGRTLGANETGELLFKCAGKMFSFYYNNPEATAEALDQEGWFHSGDLGYYDEDGEIFIVDRLKEMIKYRNHRISPIEIETVLLSHPGVKEVAVVGVPHPEDREHALAFVVKVKRSSYDCEEVTEKELVDFVAAKLTSSKHLHGGVRFVDGLAKTLSQKVRRRFMRELAKSSAQQ